MRWPFVSRARYDDLERRRLADVAGFHVELVEAAARVDIERAERIAEREAAERRYAALLDKVLKTTEPLTVAALLERSPKSIDEGQAEIAKVIREQAEGNVRLADHLRKYARELKAEGLSADAIVGKLVEWTSTETAQAAV